MNGTSDFQIGQVLAEVKNLHGRIGDIDTSLSQFKVGMGSRVEDHGNRIVLLEGGLKLLSKVAWLLFASSMGVVVAAFWKLLLKK